MNKRIISTIVILLCVNLFAYGGYAESIDPMTPSAAYEKLIAFKTADYAQKSVADFNQLLTPENGDISELLEAHAKVMASISPNDENYDFIIVTLAASLDELYCAQTNDSVGFSAYLKKVAQPQAQLPGEASIAQGETTYQFIFNALYRLHYTIADPAKLTVSERDNALRRFTIEYQKDVDGLSVADLTSANIKTVLSDQANELANTLSTAAIKLSCEIESIEVHNAGTEIVKH